MLIFYIKHEVDMHNIVFNSYISCKQLAHILLYAEMLRSQSENHRNKLKSDDG